MNVHQSLHDFMQRFVTDASAEQRRIDADENWPSPCVVTERGGNDRPASQQAFWQPVAQRPVMSFDAMEKALELTLHNDVKTFYCSYWSGNIPARAAQGHCELLQPWNPDDFARLQENLIGHVLMKRRLNQAVTLFIGVTDEEDFILSVDNQSGQVVLEPVGLEPTKILAPSLAKFIHSLEFTELG